MWAYTDADANTLSPKTSQVRRGGRGAATPKTTGFVPALGHFLYQLARAMPTWLKREIERSKLEQLDQRTLVDLGINRGDFPAILAGTFTRNQAE